MRDDHLDELFNDSSTNSAKKLQEVVFNSKMVLVSYSDSETSDTETAPAPAPAPKELPKSAASSKPAFQKVVDRSHPNKIRVTLPSATPASGAATDDLDQEAPPAKKARTGGGAFGGFNSFLPAPKRPQAVAKSTADGIGESKRGHGRGLGSGVSLKTGAAPGFSREAMPEAETILEDTRETALGNSALPDGVSSAESTTAQAEDQDGAHEVKLVGKPMMFKPLSVARKPQRKKKPMQGISSSDASSGISTSSSTAPPAQVAPVSKPRASLFSITQDETLAPVPASKREYTPLIYTAEALTTTSDSSHPAALADSSVDTSAAPPAPSHIPAPPNSGPQSLDSIATDLNLSESAKRQLFGRQRGKASAQPTSAINVLNFNTDAEYAANEALRATGETVQHNPLRAIAPGKHSLKQLVSAASTQREALEEHFATGKRNKREAGSKYGW